MISEIHQKFQQLAMHTGGTLKKYDNKVPAGDGAYLPISTYVLEYQIGTTSIVLKNELGHQNIGNIDIVIPETLQNLKLEIKSRSTFSQFWNRKKSPIEVLSNNDNLVKWINEHQAFKSLCERARIDRFEPQIHGISSANNYTISCNYHLVFNNNVLVLEPFVLFFNDLIGYLILLKQPIQ